MKISNMIRFAIDDPEEMKEFFRFAKQKSINWTDANGGDCGLIAFIKPKDRIKLYEFMVHYHRIKKNK